MFSPYPLVRTIWNNSGRTSAAARALSDDTTGFDAGFDDVPAGRPAISRPIANTDTTTTPATNRASAPGRIETYMVDSSPEANREQFTSRQLPRGPHNCPNTARALVVRIQRTTTSDDRQDRTA